MRLGVAARVWIDTVPAPRALKASTRNTYADPFVSPVTVAFVAIDTPSLNVFQFVAVVPAGFQSTR
jgi:hypothetical protein